MRAVPLALRRSPLEALASLTREPGAFLLAVPDPERPVTLVGCRPHATLTVHADGAVDRDGTRILGDPLLAIARFVGEGPVVDPELPFPLRGGTIGWLAYELGRFTGHATASASSWPLAVLRHHDPVLAWDRGQVLLLSADPARAHAPWLERLGTAVALPPGPIGAGPLASLVLPEAHLGGVRRILEYLAAGDVYQVNLTQPWEAALAAPAWVLHRALAVRHPVPYGAYLDLGETQLVVNSPELFLRRRGRVVETRPIKGTRPRGDTPARDAALAAELRADPKERAEHVMIVDLERNDLGRVCAPGSVAVASLASLESHPTVHHLVSAVRGQLRDDVGLATLLAATFPGGSITGAPKRRAMEIIRELETFPRGLYTGAIGLFGAAGDLELGLAIRSGVVRDGTVRWSAGGGIVADSEPERELAEAWLKTAALRIALRAGTEPAVLQCSSG